MRKRVGRFPVLVIPLILHPQLQSLRSYAPPHYREQPPFDLKAALGTTGDWKALVTTAINPTGEIIDSDEGPSQSKICFVRAEPQANECSWLRDVFVSKLTFQVVSSLAVEPLRSGGAPVSGLVMKAEALYPTGQVHETAIWVYSIHQDRFHLASAVNSGEVRIVSSGPLNGNLITSDWHREKGDKRWDGHRRDITVYRYDSESDDGAYRMLFAYTTTTKYGAEDASTIDAELASIEAKVP